MTYSMEKLLKTSSQRHFKWFKTDTGQLTQPRVEITGLRRSNMKWCFKKRWRKKLRKKQRIFKFAIVWSAISNWFLTCGSRLTQASWKCPKLNSTIFSKIIKLSLNVSNLVKCSNSAFTVRRAARLIKRRASRYQSGNSHLCLWSLSFWLVWKMYLRSHTMTSHLRFWKLLSCTESTDINFFSGGRLMRAKEASESP